MLVTRPVIPSRPSVTNVMPQFKSRANQSQPIDSVCFSGSDNEKYAQLRKVLLKNKLIEGKTGLDILELVLNLKKDWGSEGRGVPECVLSTEISNDQALVSYLIGTMRVVGLLKNLNPNPIHDGSYVLGEEGEKALRKAKPHLFED